MFLNITADFQELKSDMAELVIKVTITMQTIIYFAEFYSDGEIYEKDSESNIIIMTVDDLLSKTNCQAQYPINLMTGKVKTKVGHSRDL